MIEIFKIISRTPTYVPTHECNLQENEILFEFENLLLQEREKRILRMETEDEELLTNDENQEDTYISFEMKETNRDILNLNKDDKEYVSISSTEESITKDIENNEQETKESLCKDYLDDITIINSFSYNYETSIILDYFKIDLKYDELFNYIISSLSSNQKRNIMAVQPITEKGDGVVAFIIINLIQNYIKTDIKIKIIDSHNFFTILSNNNINFDSFDYIIILQYCDNCQHFLVNLISNIHKKIYIINSIYATTPNKIILNEKNESMKKYKTKENMLYLGEIIYPNYAIIRVRSFQQPKGNITDCMYYSLLFIAELKHNLNVYQKYYQEYEHVRRIVKAGNECNNTSFINQWIQFIKQILNETIKICKQEYIAKHKK